MVKPLSEINTEYEIALGNAGGTGSTPQGQPSEEFKPRIPKFALPYPDPVTPGYTPARYGLPSPDPPGGITPRPDPAYTKYTLPMPDPAYTKYALPMPDQASAGYAMPTQQYVYTAPQSQQVYTIPQPQPAQRIYTMPSPELMTAGYSPNQPQAAYYAQQPAAPQERPISHQGSAEPQVQPLYSEPWPNTYGQNWQRADERAAAGDYSGNSKKTVSQSRHTAKPKKKQSSEISTKSLTKAIHTKKSREPQQKYSVKHIIADILFYGVLLIMVVSVIMWVHNNNKPIFILNKFTMMNVRSPSMQDTIPMGSLIFVEKVDPETLKKDPETLKKGDDITFFVSKDTTYTHRIIEVYTNYDDTGELAFQTKGTSNRGPDNFIVTPDMIVGRVFYHIPKLGAILSFLPTLIMNPNNIAYVSLVFVGVIALSLSLRGLLSTFKEENNRPVRYVKKRKGRKVVKKGYST